MEHNVITRVSDWDRPPKLLMFLTLLYLAISLVTTVTVYHSVKLFGFRLPGSVILVPVLYLFGDIIAEIYGYAISRQLIWIMVLSSFVFTILVHFILILPSDDLFGTSKCYAKVLMGLERVSLAGACGFILGAFIDIYTLTKWKVLTAGKKFWVRCFFSTIISEIIVTVLEASILFVGKVDMNTTLKLAIAAYAYKVAASFFLTFPATWLMYLVKKIEKIDIYDVNTRFTPFKLTIHEK